MTKSAQIQLRVTPAEKAELVRRARALGVDLSAYMLERLLPPRALRFRALTRSLSAPETRSAVFAELHDLLATTGKHDFLPVTELASLGRLPAVIENQLAAMVETRAAQLGVPPPPWVHDVPRLAEPWFASELLSLRVHLLTHSPPAFRRRNLFVDSTIGDRV